MFGAITDELPRVRSGAVKALRTVYAANGLLVFGLWWFSEPMIRVLYGQKWLGAVAPLRVLCLAALAYPLGAVSGMIMVAIGRADLELRLSALRAISTAVVCYFGYRIGRLLGVAWCVSGYGVAMAFLDVVVVARIIRLRVTEAFLAIGGSVVLGAIIAAALLVAGAPRSGISAIALGTVGIILYGAAILWRYPELLSTLMPARRNARRYAPASKHELG
jgi:O-antigen/teichoic acid export membrane protein